ncbi:MAG: PIN domain-containing protein [Actinomycetes bacterium]
MPWVLLDTDVWSHLYIVSGRRDSRAPAWRTLLTGVGVAISAQTRAEVLAGMLIANWGEVRRDAARSQLNRTATVPVDERVIEAFAQLTAECRHLGHALQDKAHTGDRWIAATAIAWDLPLLSGDGVFVGAPGLWLHGEDRP